jgi:hypothetical protein
MVLNRNLILLKHSTSDYAFNMKDITLSFVGQKLIIVMLLQCAFYLSYNITDMKPNC